MIKSENIYGLMIDEIEDYAILLLDPKGNIMNWNKGAEKIKGYTAEEIMGKNFSVFYTKEDRENKLPEKLIKRALLEGKAVDEGWRIKKDGTTFWGSILITAIHDEHKKVIGFSKVTRDLTERKNTVLLKETLEQTREGMLKIFNASPSGMAIMDSDSRKHIEVNNNFLTTFEYSREETIGLTADELGLVSAENRKKLADILEQQGYLKNEEIECITKSGKKITCIVSVDYFEMDNKKHLLSIYHDINERKKAEQTKKDLVQTQESLLKIFNTSPSGMAIVDIESGKLLEVNKSFQSTFGFTHKESIGKTADELGFVSPETQQISFGKLKEQGYLKNENVPCVTKGGTKVDTIFSVEPFDMEGKKCFLCVLHDITIMKEVEEQINKLNQELRLSLGEQKLANNELEAFSYSVSHDLRAPLRAIRGYTKILQEDYTAHLPEDAQKMMNSVSANAELMSQLIDDLLAFSRMGKKELNIVRVNMTEVAKASLAAIKIAQHNEVKAKITIHELLPVIADKNLMGIILTNLISNAIKYSGKAANPEIEISSYHKDGENIYVVKDNGVGFDMTYYDKLFGVFQRLHGMAEFEGTGIGLALVKRIMTRHGGRVWAKAEENKGATFYIALPTTSIN